MLTLDLPSKIERVSHPILREKSINLYVKRDDLIHPYLSGNKYRKIVGYLPEWKRREIKRIITFGGPFSNHLYAMAGLVMVSDLEVTCIVRGEPDPMNPTTKEALSKGVELIYVSREEYRMKEAGPTCKELLSKHDTYLLPEGGSGSYSHVGIHDMMREVSDIQSYDFVAVCCGTGGTARAIINYLDTAKIATEVLVFNALKDDYLGEVVVPKGIRHRFISDYHFGGYGKVKPELIRFMNDFKSNTAIPLDPIYNGKVIYGLFDLIQRGVIVGGSKILWIHTGGLQGVKAYNYMCQKRGKPLDQLVRK